MKTQSGSGRKVTNVHNYWQAFKGAACNKRNFSHGNLPKRLLSLLSAASSHIWEMKHRKQVCKFLCFQFNSSFSILHVTNAVCLSGSHRAAAGLDFPFRARGAPGAAWLPWGYLPVCFHHTNEKASFLEQKSHFYTFAKSALSCQL